METVNWHRIERYGWECPCWQFNETDEDLSYQETMTCDECGKEFQVGDEE